MSSSGKTFPYFFAVYSSPRRLALLGLVLIVVLAVVLVFLYQSIQGKASHAYESGITLIKSGKTEEGIMKLLEAESYREGYIRAPLYETLSTEIYSIDTDAKPLPPGKESEEKLNLLRAFRLIDQFDDLELDGWEAQILLSIKDYDQAESFAKERLPLRSDFCSLPDETDNPLEVIYAEVLLKRGKTLEAQKHLQRLLLLCPWNEKARKLAVKISKSTSNPLWESVLIDSEKAELLKKSIDDIENSVKASQTRLAEDFYKNHPDSILALLAYIEYCNVEPEKALADLNRCLEVHPDFPEILFQRSLLKKKECKHAEELEDLNRALKVIPGSIDLLEARRDCIGEPNQNETKDSDYLRLIELEPREPTRITSRGYFLCEHGKYDQALREFEKAKAANESNALIEKLQYGSSKAKKMQLDENKRFLCSMADCYEGKKDYSKALSLVEEALAIDPKDDDCNYQKAELLFNSGNPQAAISWLDNKYAPLVVYSSDRHSKHFLAICRIEGLTLKAKAYEALSDFKGADSARHDAIVETQKAIEIDREEYEDGEYQNDYDLSLLTLYLLTGDRDNSAKKLQELSVRGLSCSENEELIEIIDELGGSRYPELTVHALHELRKLDKHRLDDQFDSAETQLQKQKSRVTG